MRQHGNLFDIWGAESQLGDPGRDAGQWSSAQVQTAIATYERAAVIHDELAEIDLYTGHNDVAANSARKAAEYRDMIRRLGG